MKTKIFCTIGPSSFNRKVLTRFSSLGVDMLRINLSHTKLENVQSYIEFLQQNADVPICIDTEGAQVRTGWMPANLMLGANQYVNVSDSNSNTMTDDIVLTPPGIISQLRVGDIISIDFEGVTVIVIEIGNGFAQTRILNGGGVGSNKAVTIHRDIVLPPLSVKDFAAIEIAIYMGLTNFALSFAGCASDVQQLRDLVGGSASIISKIESVAGVQNLIEIANASDGILIDRGDLSRQIPVERIPKAQKFIINGVLAVEKPVYVATNLLESMVVSPNPTRAEVNDIYSTLVDGASGLVLAAETAIGRWPVECAGLVRRVIHEYQNSGNNLFGETCADLPIPHGGVLIDKFSGGIPLQDIWPLRRIICEDRYLMDINQIGIGAYSPLQGFMGKEEVLSVLNRNTLLDGTIWTMPVLLPVGTKGQEPNIGEYVRLCSRDDRDFAILSVSEVFELELVELCSKLFGTTSEDHPGVRDACAAGNRFVAGEITLVGDRKSRMSRYSLEPAEMRLAFHRKGWSRVVGFHTRNVVHRAHEYIQIEALNRVGGDGILLQPLEGAGKSGDFNPRIVLASYEICLEAGFYPANQAMLATFGSWPRYAGPREAIFTALVRKNMGCSHFVVGRDHSGVGSFYEPDSARRMFEDVGDIGIEPVFFDVVAWDSKRHEFVEGERVETVESISGTRLRDSLRDGFRLPEWMVRTEVQDMLRDRKLSGERLFVQ